MRGNPDSCGIWAPCLCHADGLFWLVYTDVKRYDGNFKDAPQLHHHLRRRSTAPGPTRSTSIPAGFDPSLFHDDDGRKWFLNMRLEPPRRGHRRQSEACRPSTASCCRNGRRQKRPVRTGDEHLRRHAARTDRGAASLQAQWLVLSDRRPRAARATTTPSPWRVRASIWRPLRDAPEQVSVMLGGRARRIRSRRTGHGQYRRDATMAEVYHTFLMGRPIPGPLRPGVPAASARSAARPASSACVWGDDDWLYLEAGGHAAARRSLPGPADVEPLPAGRPSHRFRPAATCRRISSGCARPTRTALPRRRRVALSLFGRESIGSWFEQALVARRQEHFVYARRDGRYLRADDLSAGGRADHLLQPLQVPRPAS